MSAATVARTWSVRCPVGMLAFGHTVKPFTSVDAFEAYVRCMREAGYLVTFTTPFAATVERAA